MYLGYARIILNIFSKVKQLADILIEKSEKVGGKAALGRLLGVSGEAILQYTQGRMPSFSVALKWKEAFGENLISLMFEEQSVSIVEEPLPEYGDMRDELIEMQRRLLERKATLIKCMGEKEELYKSIIEHNIKG